MIPINLRISGFTSYREPVDIDFRGFDLACISGSNGAGKSSLLDAMTYALFGKARKTDEEIINTPSQKAEVTLDFEYENQIYRITRSITRGKGSELHFFIKNSLEKDPALMWKVLTERTLRETSAKIEKILNLDYDTFVNASFFLQGKADSFATQKPSDRKRILASILGLEKWEKFREAANLRTREYQAEVKLNESKLSEIQEELNQEEQHRADMSILENQLKIASAQVMTQQALVETQNANQLRLAEQQKTVNLLANQVHAAQLEHGELMHNLDGKQKKLKELNEELEKADQVESDYKHYQILRNLLTEADKQAEQFLPLDKEKQQLLNELDLHRAKLNQEIQYLLKEKNLVESKQAETETQQKQHAILTQNIEMLRSEVNKGAEIEGERTILQKKNEELQKENGSLKNQGDEINERLANLKDVKEADCPLCGQPLTETHRAELISSLETEVEQLRERFRGNQDAIKENNSLQARLLSESRTLKQKESELQQLLRDDDRLNSAIEQFEQLQKDWIKNKSQKLAQAQLELKQENFLPTVRSAIKEIEIKLATIGYDAPAHQGLRNQEVQKRSALNAFHRLEIARNTVEQIQSSVKELEIRLQKQEGQLAKLEKSHTDQTASLAAELAGLPDIQVLKSTLRILKEEEASLHTKIGMKRQNIANLDVQRKRQSDLRAETERLNQEIRNLKTLERSFGKDGVPAMLIEQAVPEIEKQANEILARLSDYTMSVELRTQRDYKDTKRDDKKETLDIVISDGSTTRDYETFSGGEAFRVNFAIRLALSRVLAKRAGAKLQTLVIDEGLSNQDTQGRQRLIEAINLVQVDFKKVLVITHIEELKEVFPNRIEVEKTRTGSKVAVITS